MKITIKKTTASSLATTDFAQLEFGKYTADHMLVADYANGRWQDPAIVPYGDITLNPSTLALHYGQTVFEGMKAFRMDDGAVSIFRSGRHYDRFARSLERMCMAVPPRELFEEGLKALVRLDAQWVPDAPGSLYIRPFMYASEAKFGVKISSEYKFIIFTGPVPELYSAPVKIKVETGFIRAAKGGTGSAKCGGNYGGAFYPTMLARQEGYDQLLWTDGQEHEFIEESGMMNIMFVMNDVLVTPSLSDSILDGVTRDSLIRLAEAEGIKVEERPVAITELIAAFENGTITEAFGVGTAAVISPVGVINIRGIDYQLDNEPGEGLGTLLKSRLAAIRTGAAPDVFKWNTVVPVDSHALQPA